MSFSISHFKFYFLTSVGGNHALVLLVKQSSWKPRLLSLLSEDHITSFVGSGGTSLSQLKGFNRKCAVLQGAVAAFLCYKKGKHGLHGTHWPWQREKCGKYLKCCITLQRWKVIENRGNGQGWHMTRKQNISAHMSMGGTLAPIQREAIDLQLVRHFRAFWVVS